MFLKFNGIFTGTFRKTIHISSRRMFLQTAIWVLFSLQSIPQEKKKILQCIDSFIHRIHGKKWYGEGERKKFLNRNVKKSCNAVLLKKKNLMGVTCIREKTDRHSKIYTA